MPNKKSWIRPELIIVKRQGNINVLGFCKYISAFGPGISGCYKYVNAPDCASANCPSGLYRRMGGCTPGAGSYTYPCACKEFQISS